ncbi:hypothetical protein A7981_02290 [Methylovorus sp. MM2]|uniref:hypothetical protein n=1 Tax=Methylovorus sp. MM2 TaxID=1848038 RepID=UPI0007E0FB32|nr:hypothetical protein [Methylovorus sp. MM2]OAM52335.1 hypothetical protein A7981_02290 [Methylovorus sp. MM2]
MFFLRLLGVLGLISVAISLGVYFLSGDKRYLRFTWQLIKFTLVLVLVTIVVIAIGRIILF